ncbi:hypothetical protein CFIO01_00797 [Colletotrichum fioriniae PJ7]|uniref:Uncharacterized protein n=1 Tax=Colletotrichum fioriniae PJ7 TaxID=1445577 RepID=A0A010R4J5_9PEZI|nr:hypothetical protein CFIO01_00797 [Colletotrichum fioriniae PJ7]
MKASILTMTVAFLGQSLKKSSDAVARAGAILIFTNDECTKVEAGAKGDCIVDTTSGAPTSSVSSPAATAQATPKPRAVDPQAWVA